MYRLKESETSRPNQDSSLIPINEIIHLIVILLFVLLVGATPFKKCLRPRRFKSDRDEIWQNVPHTNNDMQRLTKLDFRFDVTLSRWRPWRHFTQKSAAT